MIFKVSTLALLVASSFLSASSAFAQLVDTVSIPTKDSVSVKKADGTPWNRENFPRERLLRHQTFDPALTVAFEYSANFASGWFGTIAQQSYLALWNYEFSPDLHMFGAIGLWMPLYANLNSPVAREDVKQGTVQPIIPNIGLEYKFNNNSYVRIGISKEDDALKAYGPIQRYYGPWRNSNF